MNFSTTSGKKFCICRIDKEKADKLSREIGELSEKGLSEHECRAALEDKFADFAKSLPKDATRLTTFLYLAHTAERRGALAHLPLPSNSDAAKTEHAKRLQAFASDKHLATLASDKIIDMVSELPPRRHAFDVLMETRSYLLSPDHVSMRLEQIERHAPAVRAFGYRLEGLEQVISNQFDLDAAKRKLIVQNAGEQVLEAAKLITSQSRAYYLGMVAGQVRGSVGRRARDRASTAFKKLPEDQQKKVDFDLSRKVRTHKGLSTRNFNADPR